MTNQREQAREIEKLTVDAYARDRYTEAGWYQIGRRLLVEGFTVEQAAWVLTSKHARWAADHAGRNHHATAANFDAYVQQSLGGYARLLRDYHTENKPAPAAQSGADLAGACEGEEIAELIDLARMVSNGATGPRLRQIAGSLIARIENRAKGGR